MKKPKVNEPYSFRMEETDFTGTVTQLRRDRNQLPYGVIIELSSDERPKNGAQCWLDGKDGEPLGATLEQVSRAGDKYRFKLVTIIPYQDFWD